MWRVENFAVFSHQRSRDRSRIVVRPAQCAALGAHVALTQMAGVTPDPDDLIAGNIDEDAALISADPAVAAL
jgi:hypothetical protein